MGFCFLVFFGWEDEVVVVEDEEEDKEEEDNLQNDGINGDACLFLETIDVSPGNDLLAMMVFGRESYR